MKKIVILLLAATVAAVTALSLSAFDGTQGQGTVSFESRNVPALNCSMPLSQAARIYRLAPANLKSLCEGEYETVKGKCFSSSRFSHEGVQVRILEDDGARVSLEFVLSGYKVTVRNASWGDLDRLFAGTDGE